MKHRLHHDLGYQLFISKEGGLLCQCERCARRKLQCPGLGPWLWVVVLLAWESAAWQARAARAVRAAGAVEWENTLGGVS